MAIIVGDTSAAAWIRQVKCCPVQADVSPELMALHACPSQRASEVSYWLLYMLRWDELAYSRRMGSVVHAYTSTHFEFFMPFPLAFIISLIPAF
jgi:hypothetical protein